MEYSWIEKYIEKKAGVEIEYKEEWAAFLFRIKGKMFGMHGSYKDGRPILTLKLAPDYGDFLRRQYEYVIPGYYMNKMHYNSFFLDQDIPEKELQGYIDESYILVLSSLSQKARRELEDL